MKRMIQVDTTTSFQQKIKSFISYILKKQIVFYQNAKSAAENPILTEQ